MAKMTKERNRNIRAYGMGMPLVLVIYVILCLVTLSIISLLTSRQSYRNEEVSMEELIAYNTAVNQGERWVNDCKMLAGEGQDKVRNVEIEMEEGKYLSIQLKLQQLEDGSYDYTVTEWHVVTEMQSTEQTLQGW